jgi:hypothetical protein
MNPRYRLGLGLLILTAAAGCAGPLRQPVQLGPVSPGQAILVIYRVDEYTPPTDVDISSIEPVVLINGRVSRELRLGTYFEQEVEPGKVEVLLPQHQRNHHAPGGSWEASRSPRVTLTLETGETAFIELRLRKDGRFRFKAMPPQLALPELELLRSQH